MGTAEKGPPSLARRPLPTTKSPRRSLVVRPLTQFIVVASTTAPVALGCSGPSRPSPTRRVRVVEILTVARPLVTAFGDVALR